MRAAMDIRDKAMAETSALSPLEWKVVSLAMREAVELGRGAGRGGIGRLLARMMGGAGGFRPKLPLADPRLETLRRFVGRLIHRADVSELRGRLIELGFHPAQISAVTMLAR